MLVERLHKSKMKLAESCASRQQKSRTSISMPRLSKEFKLAFNVDNLRVCIVDHLDALDDLLNVLLNRALCPQMTLVVQLRVTDIANVLPKVLPDAVRQCLQIVIVPQLFHH